LPQQDAHRRGSGEEQERDGRERELAADQHRRGDRAEDPERRDAARLPANGEPGRGRADREGDRESGQRRDQLIGLDGDDRAREQTRDPGRGGRERAVGASAALVGTDPGHEQTERRRGGERGPRLLADPAARDRDDEQEQQPRKQRQPTRPREHAPAEQVLEAARSPTSSSP
jgi:hypothetical protein